MKCPSSHYADLASIPPRVFSGADELRRRLSQGAATNPQGVNISADSCSLLRNGRHWMPVMGEIHYSRCHQARWRDELLKMKAAGIDIVASYVFWIHHEEIEGEFDFSGRRSLRDFARLCGELGLYLEVRCGPWAHGECRNGGFPDWLMRKGYLAAVPKEAEGALDAAARPGLGLRSDDPGYLAIVRRFYTRIGAELRGLMWKDGGPVIGVQIENEYPGPSEHLITLKALAREAGLDVPLYTYTGWPKPQTPMPFGEMLPLYGVYAEGMWDRGTDAMPGDYWEGFAFKPHRIEATIATDHFGVRRENEDGEMAGYPYLTCELGGGMVTSYHRRVRIFPKDVAAPAVVKLGSGNSLPGFYVFHGGTNPDGKLSFLNESQATGYPNDLPVKSYDFQAPLGEFGQVRGHYHWVRRLNLFIHDFGEMLASMTPVFPGPHPAGKSDVETLRWAVRSDGSGAFIFCNNYQRLQPMGAKENVQFKLRFKDGSLTLPAHPVNIAADSFFIWPVNIGLGEVRLAYSTAELLCHVCVGTTRYVFFSETAGVPAEFAFYNSGLEIITPAGVAIEGGLIRVASVAPGLGVAIRLRATDGREVCVVLLDQPTSLACWKLPFGRCERILLTPATLLPEGGSLRCQAVDAPASTVAIFPPLPALRIDGNEVKGTVDGIFTRYPLAGSGPARALPVCLLTAAAPARAVPIGPFGVAEAPPEEEFDRTASWRVNLPERQQGSRSALLRIHYVGDVARVYFGGRLLTDNFYNGAPFEVDLGYFAPGLEPKELLVKVLPLRGDAPVYLAGECRPAGTQGVARLLKAEMIEMQETRIQVDC